MKCQKCGSEVPAGSKFCNECGAKIEQVALFKDIEPESKEPYKCKKCGKIIPSNSVFCPECHTYQKNNFKPTSDGDTEKSPDKKPIYLQSKFYLAILISALLCFTVVAFILQGNQPKSQETETTVEPTTEDSYYIDNEEEVKNTSSKMASYTLSYIDYEAPENWTFEQDEMHNYHYNSSWDLFFVGYTDAGVSEDAFDDDLIDALIESDKDTYELYRQKSKEIIKIDDHKTLHTTFTYVRDDENMFCSSYGLIIKDQLYLISFRNEGLKQSAIFDAYEEKIIDSMTTNSSGYEDETEAPTKKPTEPPTEKPTEFEDTLTELYSDSDIAVYYSDTEKYPYSDDEANVHFYIKNKMDKKIEVQADTVILDGRSYNKVICSDPISAHSEGMIEVTVEDCKNFNPSTVGADLRYFDSDTLGSTVRMNLISKKVK